MASFLPHFLSFDCCLVTFSQKFCLLSGRVKRHSLHSLLSHLAHTVASTVELFNSTGFLAHIMISFSFSNHYISFRISRVPSYRAYSTHRYQHQALPGWLVPRPPFALAHPNLTPACPALFVSLPLCWWGEGFVYLEVKSWCRSPAPRLDFWPLRYQVR